MNIVKRNAAALCSLLFLLFAVVDTASGGDYADGKLGKALILDGSSHTVKIPHYAGLKPAKAITVSAWIKPERVGKGGWQWQEIYRKEDGNARALLAIGERNKKHSLCFGLGINGSFVECGAPLAPSKLLDGKWHLVSVTFDGKAIKFYADGQEIGASTKAAGSIDTQGEAPAYIGSHRGAGEFFKGGIDDVRVYNRALSTREIKTMALADGKATVDGIVGWWKFDGDLKNSAAKTATGSLAQFRGNVFGADPAAGKMVQVKPDGDTLVPYWLYLPKEYDADKTVKFPVVLFLHGMDLRGNNLDRVRLRGPARSVRSGKHFPFILIVPQCPNDGSNRDKTAKEFWWKAGTIDKVMNIVNHEKKRLGRVDEDRVYVTGISMGGFGCYNIVSRYPKVFAAAAPVCGHGNSWPDKSKVAHIRFWAFHGAKDELVKLTDAQKTVDALKAAGASIEFTIYPDAGHNSWSKTYANPKVYEWILAQRRKPPKKELGGNKQSIATAKSKPTGSKGKRVFFTGHSFFLLGGYSAKKVDLIAKAAGKEKHELVGWRYSGGRSGAVDKWWEKGADQEPRKSVAAGKVDVLTVCTYWMKKGSEQEKSIRNFVKLMQENNPKGLIYVISTKPPSDGPYKGGWDARTKAELAKLYGWIDETRRYANNKNALVDEINKAYGKEVIREVPLYYGQALMRAQIIDGKVPGVKKQSELYSDAMGHVSELGQRLNAYTVFAAIYGESPVGLHVPEWEKSGDTVLRAQDLSLQKAAWAAVQAVPVSHNATRRDKSIEERAERNP